MATVIPAGHMQCIQPFQHVAMARPAAVTLGGSFGTSAPTLAQAQSAIDAIQAAFQAANFRGVLDSEVTLLAPTGYFRSGLDTDPLQAVVGSLATVNGTAIQDSPGAQVAVIISKLTPFVGRARRGRIYVPWWVSEAAVSEAGRITSATLTDRQTRADTFFAAWDAAFPGTGGASLLHDESSPATQPTVVTGMRVQLITGTQRRRLQRS